MFPPPGGQSWQGGGEVKRHGHRLGGRVFLCQPRQLPLTRRTLPPALMVAVLSRNCIFPQSCPWLLFPRVSCYFLSQGPHTPSHVVNSELHYVFYIHCCWRIWTPQVVLTLLVTTQHSAYCLMCKRHITSIHSKREWIRGTELYRDGWTRGQEEGGAGC